jgi:hypothetical protein
MAPLAFRAEAGSFAALDATEPPSGESGSENLVPGPLRLFSHPQRARDDDCYSA